VGSTELYSAPQLTDECLNASTCVCASTRAASAARHATAFSLSTLAFSEAACTCGGDTCQSVLRAGCIEGVRHVALEQSLINTVTYPQQVQCVLCCLALLLPSRSKALRLLTRPALCLQLLLQPPFLLVEPAQLPLHASTAGNNT